MNYFLNLILLLIGTLSYGQTLILQGNIRDANTHEAIQYVNIHVQGTNIGTVTNVYGDFLLSNMKIKPHDTLAFSSIGYKTSKLIASKITGNFKLNLVPYIRQIDQITVNEKRTVPSDILIKAYQKLPENIYNKNYQTKVFSRNFIQMDSIPISYRKSVTQVNANKDNVWYRPGEILADQYQTLPKNIFKIIDHKKIDEFGLFFQDLAYYRAFGKDFTDYLSDCVVKIDTVIFQDKHKIYVIDFFNKSLNPKILPQLYGFIEQNPAPYTVLFDNVSKKNADNIFETNQHKDFIFRRLYIDATQNFNIVKTITFFVDNTFDIIMMNNYFSLVYNVSTYSNEAGKSMLKHTVSFRKTLFEQKELSDYFNFSSLYEQSIYEPNLDSVEYFTPDTFKYENSISQKYNMATFYGTSNVSYDRWNNEPNYIRTDSLEQNAVDQIKHPEKYYDVKTFYDNIEQLKNLEIAKEKRIKPKIRIPIYLSGSISDSLSREPLAYSNIVITNLEDSVNRLTGAITNENGEFRFQIEIGYQYAISISQLGYKTISDTFDLYVDASDLESMQNYKNDLSIEKYDIEMVPDVHFIQTVTVEGETKVLDTEKQSVIITPEMRSNTIAAKDLLEKIDGVRFNKISEAVNIDGSNKVKLLVDGVEQSNEHILNINPKRVKKIEIIKNITGLYAIEGYTSILNIITYENYRGFDLRANNLFIGNFHSAKSSSFVQNNASIGLDLMHDKWTYNVKIYDNYSNTELLTRGITVLAPSQELFINGYNQIPNNIEKSDRTGVKLGTQFNINKKHSIGTELRINGFPNYRNSNTISYDTLFMSNDTIQTVNSLDNQSKSTELQASIYYNYKLNQSTNLITYLYLVNRQTSEKQTLNESPTNAFNKNSRNISYKLDFDKTFLRKYTLNIGGRYLSNTFSSKELNQMQNQFSNSFSKLTAYTFFKIQFSKNSLLIFGSSIENYRTIADTLSATFNSIQPSINYSQTFKKDHKLNIAYALNTDYPYLSDLNPQITYISPYIASVGNPELLPILYHDVSMTYTKSGKGKIDYLSAKPYYKYSDNEMGLKPEIQDSLVMYGKENFVKHEIFGLITSFSVSFNKKLNLDVELNVYKDWNRNLNTPEAIDWNGSSQLSYSINGSNQFSLMYQKEYSKSISSLGYDKSGENYLMLQWVTLQFKGKLQLMLGYTLPILPKQQVESYEETPFYIKHNYTDMSFMQNMVYFNLTINLSKGEVKKSNANINYENYDIRESKKQNL